MNFTAQKASRKGANGAFGRIAAAMVTAAAAAILIGMPVEPAWAAKSSRTAPWDDLFRDLQPRARGKPRRVAVPLPRPRPAEAPSAEPEKPPEKQQASP